MHHEKEAVIYSKNPIVPHDANRPMHQSSVLQFWPVHIDEFHSGHRGGMSVGRQSMHLIVLEGATAKETFIICLR